MYFAHAPKLVITGASSSLRETGDRAAALGAEVVVVGPAPEGDLGVPVGDVDGFDVAVVAVADPATAAGELARAARLLGPGLRRGALVVVTGDEHVDDDGSRLARALAACSGLEPGAQFDVVGVAHGTVAWQTGAEGAATARYLLGRLSLDTGASPA
jgi:hypothetical protein